MTRALPEKAALLRTQHPTLRYDSYRIRPTAVGLRLEYSFHLAPDITFTPTIQIPAGTHPVDSITERLAFLIGMVELLSYWKLACPARVEIGAAHLSRTEIEFWTDLIRHGMGEFFYVNQIPPSIPFSMVSTSHETAKPLLQSAPSPPQNNSHLVLVGGGKDSIVTLELLRRAAKNSATLQSFVLNPISASLQAIQEAGYPAPLQATRTMDPQIYLLNEKGYLNGHTPFSALLAFVSTLIAYQHGIESVLASNESSASEGNVTYEDFEINHQYSKSFAFEDKFRRYMQSSSVPVQYLSFLRPLNELQICAIFSTLRNQHQIFRSCNREQTLRARQKASSSTEPDKRSGWCAECPKCAFTYLCLSCFVSQSDLTEIFGTNPSTRPLFPQLARELAGLTEHKPFECVGTFGEVRSCLHHLFDKGVLSTAAHPELASLRDELRKLPHEPLLKILQHWNEQHFLNQQLCSLLQASLAHSIEGLP